LLRIQESVRCNSVIKRFYVPHYEKSNLICIVTYLDLSLVIFQHKIIFLVLSLFLWYRSSYTKLKSFWFNTSSKSSQKL
jgi:hypothetical protein